MRQAGDLPAALLMHLDVVQIEERPTQLIHLIRDKATANQIQQMLEELNPMIKLAVDIRRGILAGGGQMHADCEAVLLEDGGLQGDIWGANWIPSTQTVEFEAQSTFGHANRIGQ